jgi:hypothetical protein
MQHLLKLIAVWAVEREELQNLWLASNRLVQRDVLFAVGKLAAEALNARIIPASASQIFFMINSLLGVSN